MKAAYKRKFKSRKKVSIAMVVVVVVLTLLYTSLPSKLLNHRSISSTTHNELESTLSKTLVDSINNDSAWPNELSFDDVPFKIHYTLNPELENFTRNLLSSYSSSYTSVVVLDNNTGSILAAIDYNGKNKQFGKNLTFTPSSPAASIFKIITAADAIEKKETNSEDEYFYLGRATTLYKHQLQEKLVKYSRHMSLQKAFAQSNNVVFGKVALKHSDAVNLYNTATKFGFNQEIFNLVKLSPSYFPIALDEYNLAELASGLNTVTLLSPLHAAKIALIIANDGKSKSLKLIRTLEEVNAADKDDQQNSIFPFQQKPDEVVISENTANELKKMMRETVISGTAKIISRKLSKEILEKVDIGGKTGQMTGGIPEGKRDWFISFVKPKNRPHDKGISIAVMIVNQDRWYVRSTQLTKDLIQYYFNNLFELKHSNNYYSYQQQK
jgi:peptidoglycan glycosyltransferase